VIVSLATKSGYVLIDHMTPATILPSLFVPNLTFKSGSLTNTSLLVTTEREILEIDLRSSEVVTHISSPEFNDLHHVIEFDNRLAAVDAGRDVVFLMSRKGEIESIVDVGATPGAPIPRSPGTMDYRRISTKPHAFHANFIQLLHGRILVTRCSSGDVVSPTMSNYRLPVADDLIHDGQWYDSLLWFTTVRGQLIGADPEELKVVERLDLHTIAGTHGGTGWCRGLWIKDDIAAVGFSALRQTRTRAFVRRAIHPSFGDRSTGVTRIELFQLSSRRHLATLTLEDWGLDSIFSILEAPQMLDGAPRGGSN
jgi:hypothetical protein